MKVNEIMRKSSKPSKQSKITINLDESIGNAAAILKDKKVYEITVVDDDDNVVGVVSDKDLIENCDSINEDFFVD